MSKALPIALSLTIAVTFSAGLLGCPKDDKGGGGAASASASAAPPPMASTTPSASATATPTPSASAAPVIPHDCPKGSTGDGTFEKPCDAKGKDRLMVAEWNGKIDDKGPFFRVTNKSAITILYGKLVVYFYDKSGKQLDVQDTAATPPKAVPYRICSGNIFGGVMKPGEKAVVQVSCVKKEHVPEGATAIEAEVQKVGFVDPNDEKKVGFYWQNNDLVTDARKKGTK